jgi:DNA polymerase III delta prime subunit
VKTSENNENLLNSWETEGQLGAKKVLQNFIRATGHSDSQLPHAFLFLGPRAVGKYSLAKEFAKQLSAVISNHSEIFEFDFETAGSLDELRELIKFSSLTSHDSSSKTIFLLRNFQTASIGAQNTLLKTLEEPSSSSIFILVSNNNTEIPTIMSRCVPVRCYSIHADVGQSIKQYPSLEPVLNHLQDAKPGLLMHLKALQELETEDLQILLQLWVEKLLSVITGTDVVKVMKKISIAQTASQDLQKNYNPKLILQEFLLQTEKIV